jgi:hypothetical protein
LAIAGAARPDGNPGEAAHRRQRKPQRGELAHGVVDAPLDPHPVRAAERRDQIQPHPERIGEQDRGVAGRNALLHPLADPRQDLGRERKAKPRMPVHRVDHQHVAGAHLPPRRQAPAPGIDGPGIDDARSDVDQQRGGAHHRSRGEELEPRLSQVERAAVRRGQRPHLRPEQRRRHVGGDHLLVAARLEDLGVRDETRLPCAAGVAPDRRSRDVDAVAPFHRRGWI